MIHIGTQSHSDYTLNFHRRFTWKSWINNFKKEQENNPGSVLKRSEIFKVHWKLCLKLLLYINVYKCVNILDCLLYN